MSGRWRVDTWGAVPNCNNSHLHIDPSLALQAMDIDAILWPPALGWTFQERVLRSFVGHHPQVSTLCLSDATRFPGLPFHICMHTGKDRRWKLPGKGPVLYSVHIHSQWIKKVTREIYK